MWTLELDLYLFMSYKPWFWKLNAGSLFNYILMLVLLVYCFQLLPLLSEIGYLETGSVDQDGIKL